MSSTVMPTSRAANARAVIQRLCAAVGFERSDVDQAEGCDVVDAPIVLGDGISLIGDGRDDDFSRRRTSSPDDLQVDPGPHAAKENVDRLYNAAMAAGGTTAMDLSDREDEALGSFGDATERRVRAFGAEDPWRNHR
ncbi:hypothetical protein LQ948_06615 [Jiella sp. MQZ9-1]|uniref:Uncharacterized protein n=1 Tax=Jiella flava TaxID=2816857 RepID=A0A939FYE6_9HYPH|nr:hypothetical protein [Jiella flava]MBO0662293.1 hypothetical protein [Jiella flava]MCD2470876.1 hypothetical protein [Jiella flava]